MSEEQRYTEYLQNSLLNEGWENVFNFENYKNWTESNSHSLKNIFKGAHGSKPDELENEYLRLIKDFVPRGKYDDPQSRYIFESLLTEVVESALEIGIDPIRKIEIASAPSISPTAYARPATENGQHKLFIGMGVSLFSNYWAKAYTGIVKAISKFPGEDSKINNSNDLKKIYDVEPELILLPTRLALYYGYFGTLLGFGQIIQPPDYLSYRMQLLQAMEVFILGHEFTHYLVEERRMTFVDESGTPSDHELEFFCDKLGLQITREWGNKKSNYLAFCGIGHLAFYKAFEICDIVSIHVKRLIPEASSYRPPNLLFGNEPSKHPKTSERIQRLNHWTISKTASDQVEQTKSFIDEYELILDATNSIIFESINLALKKFGRS